MGACASKPRVLKGEDSAAAAPKSESLRSTADQQTTEEVVENKANGFEQTGLPSFRYLLDNEEKIEEPKTEEAIVEAEKKGEKAEAKVEETEKKEEETMAEAEKKEEEAAKAVAEDKKEEAKVKEATTEAPVVSKGER
ncbi:hypothetical protein V6N13_101504 [Hibiscus sabdariffa]|uniref:Uncharacterized protein n=1 Tax=Hibiscus sabdariffa TaxID=183260 RepID=A0ABR2QLI8_9ROSI